MKFFNKNMKDDESIISQLGVDFDDLLEEINEYIKAKGITNEKFEEPIKSLIEEDSLENLLEALNNTDITLFNDLQLKLIVAYCDNLLVSFESDCIRTQKRHVLYNVLGSLIGGTICSLITIKAGFPFSFAVRCSLLVAGVVGGLYVAPKIFGKNPIYNRAMKKLDKAMGKIFLLISERERTKTEVKEVSESLEKQETLQNRINRVDREIVNLVSSKGEELYNRLMLMLNEYQRQRSLDSEVDIHLERCGKPYYEYDLEKELDVLEKEIAAAKLLGTSSEDIFKNFEDFSVNVAQFSDKKEALLELMNMVRGRLNPNDVASCYNLLSSFARCFWDTIKVTDLVEQVEIIQSIAPEFMDRIIAQGEAYIRESGDVGLNRQLDMARSTENMDKRVYLMLLLGMVSKSRKDNLKIARENKSMMVATN